MRIKNNFRTIEPAPNEITERNVNECRMFNREPLKNEKLERKYIEFVMDMGSFFREKSHSAKNHQESPMLAKCFLSSKDQGGFNENKLRK